MHPYLSHTEGDLKKMLDTIGVSSIDELFKDIPESMRLKNGLDLPKAKSEMEVRQIVGGLAAKNLTPAFIPSFLGAGVYDHYIPSIIPAITSRSEYYTAYTPYQPEVSQGTLQYIFEFQTMICDLTGMDVANASVYDQSNAVVEAAIMCANVAKKKKIIVSETLNPSSRAVLKTYAHAQSLEVVTIPHKDGETDIEKLKSEMSDDVAAVIVQSPNFFGIIEDAKALGEVAHTGKKTAFVMSVDPISLGILKKPSELGADVVIGEGQALGINMSFGGPYLGFMAVKEKFMRKMPGRIVGQTTDRNGKRCWVMTLTAREQHIRREKATSNICSNQGLNTLAASIYMCTMGKSGLQKVATQCIQKAHYLQKKLEEKGLKLKYNKPFFKEFVVTGLSAEEQSKKLFEKNIIGGVGMGRFFEDGKNDIMYAVTEKRTKEEMDALADYLEVK
ncbi:MAG: aminomethyl-transferring glycine dehydrogenase subunit GcvPA [Ezakiella sp.]|nr:aminomethyl-transferring glycine dehydrogenase subunit GcvPA [Bacillota bacterium]MDY3947386.1 aminomethyl-transferring glycine dehydrogenase subunit GcvPA [Ezakiella sp.]